MVTGGKRGFVIKKNCIKIYFAQIMTFVLLQQQRPWNTMECSQPDAQTSSWSLLMASCVMAFLGRPTNSSSTLPRAAYLEGGVVRRHQCTQLALGKCSGIIQHASNPSWLCPTCMPSITSIPALTQPTIAMTNYTLASTVTNSSTFHT